jgi:hypothetical protein
MSPPAVLLRKQDGGAVRTPDDSKSGLGGREIIHAQPMLSLGTIHPE